MALLKPPNTTKEELIQLIDEANKKINEYENMIKQIEDEEQGIHVINSFAWSREDILFLDFSDESGVSFNNFRYDYNFSSYYIEMPDTPFTAECGSSRSEISACSDINLAINEVEERIASEKQLVKFLKEQRTAGIKWVADINDCLPKKYDMEN